MATEVLYPDAISTQTGLTGTVSDIAMDADTSASDGTYLSSNGSTVCTLIATFPTPSAAPTGNQILKYRLRQVNDPSGTQYVTADIRDGATSLIGGSLQEGLSGTSWQTYTAEFNASNLVNADGSDVNIYLYGGYSGTPPTNRWSWEISALEWDAEIQETVTVSLPPESRRNRRLRHHLAR